jgi:hypothetical protein
VHSILERDAFWIPLTPDDRSHESPVPTGFSTANIRPTMALNNTRIQNERRSTMKKLMTLTLGLSFLATTVIVAYGQDTKTSTSKKKSGKKHSSKKTDTSKQ